MPTDLEPPEPYRSERRPDLPGELDLPYSHEQLRPQHVSEDEPFGYAHGALQRWYKDRPWVTVGKSLTIQYAVDGEHLSAETDILVAFDVPQRESWSYIVWRERKPPDLVLDVPPVGYWRGHLPQQKAIYETLGIAEYWVLDVTAPDAPAALTGYRLVNGRYETIPALPGTETTFMSDLLRLELRVEPNGVFRFRDPESGADLLPKNALEKTNGAFTDALGAVQTAYAREVEARRAAEARVAELEALLRGRGD